MLMDVVGLLLRYGIWFPTRISWTNWVSMWSSSSVHSLRFRALLYCWNFCRHWKALRLVFPRPDRNKWALLGFTLHMQKHPEQPPRRPKSFQETGGPAPRVALCVTELSSSRLVSGDGLLDRGWDPGQEQLREDSTAYRKKTWPQAALLLIPA